MSSILLGYTSVSVRLEEMLLCIRYAPMKLRLHNIIEATGQELRTAEM